MLKVSTVTYKILLEISEVSTPKCVKNEIFLSDNSAIHLTKSPRHDNIYKLCL